MINAGSVLVSLFNLMANILVFKNPSHPHRRYGLFKVYVISNIGGYSMPNPLNSSISNNSV